MANSNFIDYVKIFCRSGKGGAGSCHFHRAKYVPKGGPDGGNGGRGGHIILRGNRNLWTLLHLKYQRHVFAGDGQAGSEGRSSGKDGEDRVIEVPCGTAVYDADSGKFLCEVTDDGQEVKLLRGGRGGLGNWNFKSPTNRTPRYAQPGEPAIEKSVVLELKLLADVGLVGFPPGIIEGASEGKGLGLRFLRHIERNAVLLFMIPADAGDIRREYSILLGELERFNPDLVNKGRVLAITKCDMLDDELIDEMRHSELPDGVETVFISSVTGMGLTELKDVLWRTINDEDNRIPARITHRDLDVNHRVDEEDAFVIEQESGDEEEAWDVEWPEEYWADDFKDED